MRAYLDDIIAKEGMISLHDYMDICLNHPDYGYYVQGNPIGKEGDFITAPEMTQIFGELIGIFIITHIQKMVQSGYHLIELGAGRGTLLKDVLRVLERKNAPQSVMILESNQKLEALQKQAILGVNHIKTLNELPEAPIFVLANEFFDALPIHAYKYKENTSYEVMVRGQNGHYEFCQKEAPEKTKQNFYEDSPAARGIMQKLAQHISHYGGGGLFIDYGYITPPNKLTFRGFKEHIVTDGLSDPFMSDLTADVDFQSLQDIARTENIQTYDILTQKDFLEKMYMPQRLQKLLKNADTAQKESLLKASEKLSHPDQMGTRFKFMAMTQTYCDLYPFQPV
ncbi:MAG: SAM-dependent methyltransferase [Pseudomonadota bacterium]